MISIHMILKAVETLSNLITAKCEQDFKAGYKADGKLMALRADLLSYYINNYEYKQLEDRTDDFISLEG